MRVYVSGSHLRLPSKTKNCSLLFLFFAILTSIIMRTNKGAIMERQIDCPECGSTRTYPTPETAFERFCSNCPAVWDIRSAEEIAAE